MTSMVQSVALSKFRWLLLQASVLLLIAARPASQIPTEAQRLINELPPCSVLREDLERGTHGNGVDEPYMARMRAQGVQRVRLTVRAVFRRNRVESAHVVRRLYFRRFDSADAQISDEVRIQAIDSSGLGAVLDDLARNRVATAPLVRGERPFMGGKVASIVEFFSDPWLPEQKVLVFPAGHPAPLTDAVVSGDVVDTQALLQSHKFYKKQLDRALFDVMLSRYDNTNVIDLLLKAGADVNSRAPDGSTPLMSAVGHPCNLRSLLDRGADLNARDKWGRNALQVARENKVVTSIRLLEEAMSKRHGLIGRRRRLLGRVAWAINPKTLLGAPGVGFTPGAFDLTSFFEHTSSTPGAPFDPPSVSCYKSPFSVRPCALS